MKQVINFAASLTVASLSIASLSLLTNLPATAITYGTPDGDGHPNVARLLIRDRGSFFTCTGSLLHESPTQYVILTAAHCVRSWDDVGISFDSISRTRDHFVFGGEAVIHPLASSKNFSYLDVALVVFPKTAKNALGQTIADRWSNLEPIKVPQDVGFSLDHLVASVSQPTQNLTFVGVGFGRTEELNAPGTGGNPGGSLPAITGIRLVADRELFLNLREQTLFLSQNPARYNNGTCSGDSGGPHFYLHPRYGEIQVAVTSTGDGRCRATNDTARIDTPEVAAFINCGRNNNTFSTIATCVSQLPNRATSNSTNTNSQPYNLQQVGNVVPEEWLR